MTLAVAKRPEPAAAPDGIALELQPLLSAYGRDRRVALRVERMPSRARLSRGRNNGDGSWSLTRDELNDVCYFAPKDATELPTLVVRIIGLDSDNGATLAVVDFPVLHEPVSASDAGSQLTARYEEELRGLRAELAKSRAQLRSHQTEFASVRKAWDAELEQRINDAADEAVATLEERRAAWMAETKDRLLKTEARALERLEQARERWRQETESELAKAEEVWKTAEGLRLAAAETHWKEETARARSKETAQIKQLEAALAAARAQAASSTNDGPEIAQLRAEIATLGATLDETQAALEQSRERARADFTAALAEAEALRKNEETKRLKEAEAVWREESARALAEAEKRRAETEAALEDARAQALANASDKSEFERLHDEITALQAALAEREHALAAEKESLERLRQQSARETGEALAQAEQSWKAAEAERLNATEARWHDRTKELAARLAQAEAALAEADAGRERRETAETRRLRAELSVLRENHAGTEQRLVEAEERAEKARRESETANAALARAKECWKKDEAQRFAAAEAGWQTQSVRVLGEMTAKLERAEAELAKSKSRRDRQDETELRRLTEALDHTRTTLLLRESELESAREAAKSANEGAREEFERALAEAKKAWEAEEESRLAEAKSQWKEQSDRLFKKATVRLEGAEAALADARAEANVARDRRDSAELRRLRSEFATVRATLAEREADLAQAQVAAGRARERTREEVDAALGKAEEAWKSGEAIRIAEAETRERERGARALAEAVARLERTEAALADLRAQLEAERERAAVAAAEATARIERSESALAAAQNRIDRLRDPANESELARLRTELAALQIAHADREAELAKTRAGARKSRESWAERTQASLQRAEDLWRIEEAQRLEAARREWQRDARLAAAAELADAPPEPAVLRKANRLVLDAALAVVLAGLVVLGITFYPKAKVWFAEWQGGDPPPRVVTAQSPKAAVAPPQARAIVAIATARLKRTPQGSATTLATLSRGSIVEPGERHGVWIRVRVAAHDASPALDGWVRAASLEPAKK